MTTWHDDSPAATPPVDDGGPDTPLPTCYKSTDEFVRDYLRWVYSRRIDGRGVGRVWSARWWDSPEAVVRLEALWRSWENLRLDGATGLSFWLRDHADYHMNVLFDPDGPFAGSTDACERTGPLPYEPPPAGMFPAT
jgi:hypothetical protein